MRRMARISLAPFTSRSLFLQIPSCLATLPPREFRAGYAEVVKYGLIGDLAFFRMAGSQSAPKSFPAARRGSSRSPKVAPPRRRSSPPTNMNRVSGRCSISAILLRHAFERLTHYDGRNAWCMAKPSRSGWPAPSASRRGAGSVSGAEAARVEAHLRAAGLPTHIRDIPGWDADAAAIVEAMMQDKKVKRGVLTFILAHGIGRCFIAEERRGRRRPGISLRRIEAIAPDTVTTGF